MHHLSTLPLTENVPQIRPTHRCCCPHPAGHGWWRVAAPAPKPESSGNLLANILTGRMFRRSKSAASVSDGGPAHSQSDSALLRGTGLANSSGGHH